MNTVKADGRVWHDRVIMGASCQISGHLDLNHSMSHVLYGVNYIDPVSLAPFQARAATTAALKRWKTHPAPSPIPAHQGSPPCAGLRRVYGAFVDISPHDATSAVL